LKDNLWDNSGEIAGNGVDDSQNGYVDDANGSNGVTGSGNPSDDNGHGTHASGSIGAGGNNRSGVAGVCPASEADDFEMG
jgi:subtilisin family serine protease